VRFREVCALFTAVCEERMRRPVMIGHGQLQSGRAERSVGQHGGQKLVCLRIERFSCDVAPAPADRAKIWEERQA
jgi:hypothetical protein